MTDLTVSSWSMQMRRVKTRIGSLRTRKRFADRIAQRAALELGTENLDRWSITMAVSARTRVIVHRTDRYSHHSGPLPEGSYGDTISITPA